MWESTKKSQINEKQKDVQIYSCFSYNVQTQTFDIFAVDADCSKPLIIYAMSD